MYNPYSLFGKTVLITGASSGIGQATAVECARMGAHVIITGRNKERLEETFSLLEGDGHQKILLDLSSPDEISTLVESLPVVDGVLHSAGITATKPIGFITEQEWTKLLAVNVNAPMYLTNLLVKKKKISKAGSIVFMSSIGRYMTAPGGGMYTASKGALSAFMKATALELASKQIRCNAVLPGMVETPLIKSKESVSEDQWEDNKQLYPLRRFGTPEEIAWLVIYLLSDASRFVTGSEFVIDGGRSLK